MADFSTQVSSASSLRRPLPRTSSLVDTEDISGEKVSGGWSDVTKVTCFDLLLFIIVRIDDIIWLRLPYLKLSQTNCWTAATEVNIDRSTRSVSGYDWCCQSSAARLCKSPSTHRATTPSHQVRSSGVLCCRLPAWNSLQDYLHDPSLSEYTFRRSLKCQNHSVTQGVHSFY